MNEMVEVLVRMIQLLLGHPKWMEIEVVMVKALPQIWTLPGDGVSFRTLEEEQLLSSLGFGGYHDEFVRASSDEFTLSEGFLLDSEGDSYDAPWVRRTYEHPLSWVLLWVTEYVGPDNWGDYDSNVKHVLLVTEESIYPAETAPQFEQVANAALKHVHRLQNQSSR